jgi:putative ABC transport system permease protein
MVLTVRSASDPLQLTSVLREGVRETDPTQPISRVTTMNQYLSDRLGEPRLSALVLAGFGLTALLLAAIGIYGVISFSVTRRTREIGIRIALGAAGHEVMWMVVGEAVLLASLGVAAGIGAALSLTRVMQGMLFGVSATEPLTYMLVAALLILTGALAAYLPARRAARISPSTALRCE